MSVLKGYFKKYLVKNQHVWTDKLLTVWLHVLTWHIFLSGTGFYLCLIRWSVLLQFPFRNSPDFTRQSPALTQFALKVPLFTAWPFCRWSALTWAASLFIGNRRLYHITMNDVFVWYETRPDLFCDQIIRDGSRHSLPVHSFYRAADCWLQSADSCQRDIHHCCIPDVPVMPFHFDKVSRVAPAPTLMTLKMWYGVLMLCCWLHRDSHDSNLICDLIISKQEVEVLTSSILACAKPEMFFLNTPVRSTTTF